MTTAAILTDERTTSYQAAAVTAARRVMAGRTTEDHIEIVWANFSDVFPSYRSFLVAVAGRQLLTDGSQYASLELKELDAKSSRKTIRGRK